MKLPREVAATEMERLREQLKPAPPPSLSDRIVPKCSLGGWVVRLAALVLVLRWRSLFKLIGRLGKM